MRIPRSEVEHRFAKAFAVLAPSPMAVKSSSSTAALSAAVCWCALSVLNIRRGEGCWMCAVVAMIVVPFQLFLRDQAGEPEAPGGPGGHGTIVLESAGCRGVFW